MNVEHQTQPSLSRPHITIEPGSTRNPRYESPSPRRTRSLPSELRKVRRSSAIDQPLLKRLLHRLQTDAGFLRSTVQLVFLLLVIWIGVEFHLFMQWGLLDGMATFVSRPPGVEGFLPISALISLMYWFHTGIVNDIHPSGLVILLAIIAISVVATKSFCSWMCPIGTISESLWTFGKRVVGRTFDLPRGLDYPLRAVKYLLLLFFLWAIVRMDTLALERFIYSPYNKVADIKMYLFFADISLFAASTILILVVLSVVVKNFWCRYLCPYGALLGLFGLLSPLKIRRSRTTCIDCGLCTKACPARINVHNVTTVRSDECTLCLRCTDACPVRETLVVRAPRQTSIVPSWILGTLIVGTFVAITGTAMLLGAWSNRLSDDEYLRRIQHINAPIYQHFHGQVPEYGPND